MREDTRPSVEGTATASPLTMRFKYERQPKHEFACRHLNFHKGKGFQACLELGDQSRELLRILFPL